LTTSYVRLAWQSVTNMLAKGRSMLRLLNLKPHDVSTAPGRAEERLRRAALFASTAGVSKLIAMALPIITIPIALNYLGQEIYGLWITVSSFIGMFVFADLGLGNGLLTALSRATGRGDVKAQQRLISTTTFLLAGSALVLGIVFFALLPFLPWAAILNARTPAAASTVEGVVAVIAFCFLLNLPLSTVQRSQLALQEGYLTNLWQCLGSFCAMAGLLLGVKAKLPPALLVLAISGMPLLITAANWWWFFHRAQPSLRPKLEHFSRQEGGVLLRVGAAFLILSILSAVGMYSDNIIIAQVCDLKTVTIYSVPARITLMLGAIINMICVPMWVANGEALARGDIDWVRQNTARLLKVSVFFTTFAAIGLIVIGPPVLRLWLGNDFVVSRWLLLGLAASAVLVSASAPYFVVLNGASIISPQVKIFLVFTPIVLVAKIVLGKWFGPTGIAFANAACYALIVLPAVVTLCRKVLGKNNPRSTTTAGEAGFPLAPSGAEALLNCTERNSK
jgi:O-antigen/teichoic acid export membrane protein